MTDLIRPACGPDLPYLYEICLKTGDAGKDASGLFYDPLLLGQYYVAPYFFHDPGLCFVAEDDHPGKKVPQGYIVAAADTLAFNRWMETLWLPPLRRRYPKPYPKQYIRSSFEEQLLALLHRSLDAPESAPPWISSYPAHLHIDLLPLLQGQGAGKGLMRTLLEALARRGCPGVHLGVSAANTRAIGFYRKLGFSTLQEQPWGFTLGLSV
ncbi:MAG: GNAT family N-acetyltransferase [Treponema sp.]|jgi:ribosomal protein S18 acetylase RimI-like enzyme|nr:GNAT family N-acetyltransferase [Treponema sp.]